VNPSEFDRCLDAAEAREVKRYRAKAWRVVLCGLACFWIAVGGWAFAETTWSVMR
jgi:hypothetical protein